jgi:hypothetical protein
MEELLLLQGPVLKVNGRLTLLVPIEDVGSDSIECRRGSSEVSGAYLKIVIPDWLAGMLRIEEGDVVCVNNWDGTFEIRPNVAGTVH